MTTDICTFCGEAREDCSTGSDGATYVCADCRSEGTDS